MSLTGALMLVVQYGPLIAELLETGVTTTARVRASLASLGATDGQLAQLDAALAKADVDLTARIARRQQEHGAAAGGPPPAPSPEDDPGTS